MFSMHICICDKLKFYLKEFIFSKKTTHNNETQTNKQKPTQNQTKTNLLKKHSPLHLFFWKYTLHCDDFLCDGCLLLDKSGWDS